MIKNTYNRVYNKLQSSAALRNNDRLLMLEIWRDQGLHLTPEQERKFMDVLAPETIRRTRQKVQEDGHFPASVQTHEARKENEYQVKKEILSDRLSGRAISWLNDD